MKLWKWRNTRKWIHADEAFAKKEQPIEQKPQQRTCQLASVEAGLEYASAYEQGSVMDISVSDSAYPTQGWAPPSFPPASQYYHDDWGVEESKFSTPLQPLHSEAPVIKPRPPDPPAFEQDRKLLVIPPHHD